MLTALDNAEVEALTLRVIPDGANDPGLPIPMEVEYTPEDLERMAKLWDKINPSAAGLLNSPVINRGA